MLLIFLLPLWTKWDRALMSDSLMEDMIEILDGALPQMVLQHKGELCGATRIVLQSSIFLQPAVMLFSQGNCLCIAVRKEISLNCHGLKERTDKEICGFWMYNCLRIQILQCYVIFILKNPVSLGWVTGICWCLWSVYIQQDWGLHPHCYPVQKMFELSSVDRTDFCCIMLSSARFAETEYSFETEWRAIPFGQNQLLFTWKISVSLIEMVDHMCHRQLIWPQSIPIFINRYFCGCLWNS